MENNVNIAVTHAGKKFGKDWVFRRVNVNINQGEKIVILGLNGSGKSTLLQAITSYLSLNEGTVIYELNGKKIDDDKIYHYISLASPYLELLEDFTMRELIEHTVIFKPFLKDLSTLKIIELSGLREHAEKSISAFSSGMKQRLKLTLAILADTPILFLDEPTTNLDAVVTQWYTEMINKFAMHKTIIVCSNSIKEEYEFCNTTLMMENYKDQKMGNKI